MIGGRVIGVRAPTRGGIGDVSLGHTNVNDMKVRIFLIFARYVRIRNIVRLTIFITILHIARFTIFTMIS